MRTIIHRGSTALLALLWLVPALCADEKPKPAPRAPDRTELWVPSKHMEKVLEKNKTAVMLTPEQYDALIRDAGKLKPDEAGSPPPVSAVVEGIHLSAKVADGESGIRLHGEITARALTQGWSSATISLPWQTIGKLSTTGDALLANPAEQQPKDKSAPVTNTKSVILWLKGPAAHRIQFECVARIVQGGSPDERVLFFVPAHVPAVLDLELPVGAQITQGPSRETKGNVHRFFLNGAQGAGSVIAWRLVPPAGTISRISTQSLRGTCRVSGSELTSTYDVMLSSTVTDSPAREIAFSVSPPDASVIAVEGDKVESWSQTGAALAVKLAGEARSSQLRVELRVPFSLPEKEPLPVEVPAMLLSGARQVPAIVEMIMEDGVELLELQPSRSRLAAVAEWDAAAGKTTATIRKVSPRIVVDADARVLVGRDLVEIERTLNVATDAPVDHLHVKLPDDEGLLEVNWLSGPKLDWKRVSQTVEIEWLTQVNAREPGKLTIKSRKKLENAAASQTISITNIVIEDAKKLAGYIALDHEPGWRVALKETNGLEDRDVRLTPVKGKLAWFSLRDFRLGFQVQRKESVVDAEVTAYALPRAKSVEIEGQIALDITGAPLRQIEVRVTKEMAKLLRFTSPLIGEQTLDEATGAWKLTLTRESTGRVALRFRLSLPGKANAATGAATPLVATLPRFEIPASRRFHGSWVVEANTDTQLSFATQSLQPIDVMRVPAVEDYTPRHRLVAAFAYGTGAHELTVTAARHANSELAALVVNQLNLTSVLSQDGTSKHEALIQLRHTGEQFAHVKLPAGSQLLSVIVDGHAVKPVRGENEAIAIPLPGGSANADNVTARLIYELPGEPWTATGAKNLEPITILGNAPILATDWRVRVPDGFSYSKVNTGLEQSGTFEPEGIISKLNPLSLIVPTFGSTKSIAPGQVTFAAGGADDDQAMRAYQDELRRDPRNQAARRGLEELEMKRSARFETARDHTRATVLANVDAQWETKVPVAPDAQKKASKNSAPLMERMNRIILPQVSFSDATIEEAIEFLRYQIRGDDIQREPSDLYRGLNLVLNDGGATSSSKITVDLRDVSLADALRYITELAGFTFRVDANAVVIFPAKAGAERLAGREIADQSTTATGSTNALKSKMDRIVFPQVSFSGATIEEAIEFLRVKSRDLDTTGDVRSQSVNIVLKNGETPLNAQVSLDLKDVSLSEALRYITELAGMKYRVESNAVVIAPLTDSGERQIVGFSNAEHTKSGLIPLELDLPTSGQLLRFSGTHAPEVLSLRYVSWERQMALACGMMAVGGLVFAVWGKRRACMRTVLMVLVLSLGVKLFAESWLPLANAALFGWLVALGLWVVFRVLGWIGRKADGDEIEMRKEVVA